MVNIFGERDLQDYFDGRRQEAKRAVGGLADGVVLARPIETLVDEEVQRFTVERLNVRCDDAQCEIERRQIPADAFPQGRGFNVHRGNFYPKDVVRYEVPFDGNRVLLTYGHLKYAPWSMPVEIAASAIRFEIVAFSGDLAAVEKEALGYLENLKSAASRYDGDVVAFNDSLRAEAIGWARQRRQDAERTAAALPLLKIPLKRVPHAAVPATLVVPVSRKQVAVKPSASSAPRQEWVLGDDLYESVLGLVHDWGVVMERHPSTYAGKDEEALRDLFLLLLAPHFDYSGGETFNKLGKTDILIRHEKANVFVAECKVWHGQAEFLRAVDQLLGYLTWRDSKTALIIFVRNQDIEIVRRQIDPTLRNHPCFVSLTARQEGWTDAQLRLAQGSERTARCAVLVFHMPES